MTDPIPGLQDKGKARAVDETSYRQAEKQYNDTSAHTREGQEIGLDAFSDGDGITTVGPMRVAEWASEIYTQVDNETAVKAKEGHPSDVAGVGSWLSNDPKAYPKPFVGLSTAVAGPSHTRDDDPQENHLPLRRYGSGWVPPSTPPEAQSYGRLSIPTLPTLRFNTDLNLMEEYRIDRREGPAGFDQHTEALTNKLIAAKLQRGGTGMLLPNEYSVEVASRLDATDVEMWMKDREDLLKDKFAHCHVRKGEDVGLSYLDLPPPIMSQHEDEPEPGDSYVSANSPATNSPVFAAAVTQAGEGVQVTGSQGEQVPSHARSMISHGSIRYHTTHTHETNGNVEKRTMRTFLDVTRVVEVTNGQGHEHDAILESSQDIKEIIEMSCTGDANGGVTPRSTTVLLPRLHALLEVLD